MALTAPPGQRKLLLTPGEQAGVESFVAHLRQRYGDELLRVVLFGSKARGDSDADSDLDVLVVLRSDGTWDRWREITDLTTRLLLETGVNISALVRDETCYQWWATHHAPIYNTIQRDGVELWTKRSAPAERFITRLERYLREVGAIE